MKSDDDSIPVDKLIDDDAMIRRREEYALSRDKQAADYNNAIAKLMDEKEQFTCIKCGKVFHASAGSGNICAECRIG